MVTPPGKQPQLSSATVPTLSLHNPAPGKAQAVHSVSAAPDDALVERADAGAISLYYASRTFISAKTRVFVDFVVNAFKSQQLHLRFAGSLR